jgi:hypothetical protein
MDVRIREVRSDARVDGCGQAANLLGYRGCGAPCPRLWFRRHSCTDEWGGNVLCPRKVSVAKVVKMIAVRYSLVSDVWVDWR